MTKTFTLEEVKAHLQSVGVNIQSLDNASIIELASEYGYTSLDDPALFGRHVTNDTDDKPTRYSSDEIYDLLRSNGVDKDAIDNDEDMELIAEEYGFVLDDSGTFYIEE